MSKFDQYLSNFLKESPPAPGGNQNTIDLTKLTPEQLQELVVAANTNNKTVGEGHPLFQKPQVTPNNQQQTPQNSNTINNTQKTPVTPNQQNAANKPTV